MENFINLLNLLNNNSSQQKDSPPEQKIPKEILDQYPYGEFPTRYTRSGQENIRKNSENRYSYSEPTQQQTTNENINNSSDISSLMPLIQLMSGKQEPKDMMKILSKMLFKDNKDIEKIFDMISPKNKSQEIKNDTHFPDTNKIKISSLRRIDE